MKKRYCQLASNAFLIILAGCLILACNRKRTEHFLTEIEFGQSDAQTESILAKYGYKVTSTSPERDGFKGSTNKDVVYFCEGKKMTLHFSKNATFPEWELIQISFHRRRKYD